MTGPQVMFDHVRHELSAHDLAQPVSVVIPGQTSLGQQVFLVRAIGGLTKLEAVTAQIAAAMVNNDSTLDDRELACFAADLAEAVLAECARRQQPTEATDEADEVGAGRILTP